MHDLNWFKTLFTLYDSSMYTLSSDDIFSRYDKPRMLEIKINLEYVIFLKINAKF